MVTSVNGVAYIAAPAVGVLLYGAWMPLPFVATAAVLLMLAAWVKLADERRLPWAGAMVDGEAVLARVGESDFQRLEELSRDQWPGR